MEALNPYCVASLLLYCFILESFINVRLEEIAFRPITRRRVPRLHYRFSEVVRFGLKWVLTYLVIQVLSLFDLKLEAGEEKQE